MAATGVTPWALAPFRSCAVWRRAPRAWPRSPGPRWVLAQVMTPWPKSVTPFQWVLGLRSLPSSLRPCSAAMATRGQAVSCQSTEVKLGILELVKGRTRPPSALEECFRHDPVLPEGGTSVRHLVIKVPGNMKRPNLLSQ